MHRALGILVLVSACRIGFDELTTDAGPGPAVVVPSTGIPCPLGSSCHQAPAGSYFDVTCEPNESCHVECEAAEVCTVNCNGAAPCVVACPADDCVVSGCLGSECAVSCAGGGETFRTNDTAICP